jgi:hypothetical protein
MVLAVLVLLLILALLAWALPEPLEEVVLVTVVVFVTVPELPVPSPVTRRRETLVLLVDDPLVPTFPLVVTPAANNANINKSTRASNLAGSNTVRETRFGSTSTGNSNTRTSSNVERISTGSNAEMITVETAAVEPIMYTRTIYRDQSE